MQPQANPEPLILFPEQPVIDRVAAINAFANKVKTEKLWEFKLRLLWDDGSTGDELRVGDKYVVMGVHSMSLPSRPRPVRGVKPALLSIDGESPHIYHNGTGEPFKLKVHPGHNIASPEWERVCRALIFVAEYDDDATTDPTFLN